jgi:hypothetical protein
LKALNEEAKAVMDILTTRLNKVGDHKKIDKAPEAFMPVHVELIGTIGKGHLFSVAHYWEHPSGDLMADPEMIFWKHVDGAYYPIYFKQDGGQFLEQRSVYFKDGQPFKVNREAYEDQATFSEMWMRNIREQQQL